MVLALRFNFIKTLFVLRGILEALEVLCGELARQVCHKRNEEMLLIEPHQGPSSQQSQLSRVSSC